jgi:hypothetical protein
MKTNVEKAVEEITEKMWEIQEKYDLRFAELNRSGLKALENIAEVQREVQHELTA